MFNGTGPLSGSSSIQNYDDGQFLPEQPPVLTGNKCSVCHKTFERLYNLKVHLRKHTGETPYDCPIKGCQKQFKWRSSMAHHVRAHHDVSETVGVEVKCHARRNDQNVRYSNASRKSTAQSMTSSAPRLSSGGVKKTGKKKVIPKAMRMEQAVEDNGFNAETHQTQNICILPQWGVGQSFHGGLTSNFMQNAQATASTSKELESGQSFELASESIHSEEKVPEEGTNNADQQLLEMVSEIFSRSTVMLQDCEETVPQIPETSSEALDSGLLFLADGSEDATDAEMESLAHYGGNLSVSTSKETQTSSDIAFALP